MLFLYLLKISPETLILHSFNDSYSSQQYSSTSREQLCTPNNNLDITKLINESCVSRESLPAVLPNADSACCSNFNVNIGFNEGMMEIHFIHSFIEICVNYLDCTRKF